jgi:hypothetical protein
MPLHSPLLARERILSTGGSGTGKSFDLLTIARMSQRTRSDAVFYVADTDYAIDRMLETEFDDLTNVRSVPCASWSEAAGRVAEVGPSMRPDDWLCVDLLTPTWDMVQEYFSEQVFGERVENYFLAARVADTKGHAFDGWKDWSVINRLYKSMMNDIMRARGHVYATAVGEPVNADQTEREILAVFGAHGVKPKGQKHTPHYFHSCLIKKYIGDQRLMVTAKDRGREYLAGAPITNFATDYLVRVAGWKLA